MAAPREIPKFLREGPQGPPPPPPVASAAQDLPFGELSWENFERLCLRLAERTGDVEHIQLFGTRGQAQSGIDLFSRDGRGRYTVYQCKRYAGLRASDISSAVSRLLDGPWAQRARKFVFCTSHSIRSTQLVEEAERQHQRLRDRERPIQFVVWDADALARELKGDASVVRDFFGTAWAERFCGDALPDGHSESPEVFSVPLRRNPYFRGRDDVLARVRAKLEAASRGVALAQLLAGSGGFGKTQTAIEYAYRYADDYDLVWWVPAEDASEARRSLADLAQRLGVAPDTRSAPPETATLDEWLRTNPRWLIIFDNAEEPGALDSELPHGRGHVLITSRRQDWGAGVEVEPLDVLDVNDAALLLQARSGRREPDAAQALAEELGCLPLALEQAAAYVAASRHLTLEAYRALYQTRANELWRRGRPSFYDRTVATTWLLSFERVEHASSAATDLLTGCAFLSPDGVPQDLFATATTSSLPTLSDELARVDAVTELARHSLLKINGDVLALHRLVAAQVRERTTATDRQRVLSGLEDLLLDLAERERVEAATPVDGSGPLQPAYLIQRRQDASRSRSQMAALAANVEADTPALALRLISRLMEPLDERLLLDRVAGDELWRRNVELCDRGLSIADAAHGPNSAEGVALLKKLFAGLQPSGRFRELSLRYRLLVATSARCGERDDATADAHLGVARTWIAAGVQSDFPDDFDDAEAHLRWVEALARRGLSPRTSAIAVWTRGELAVARGDLDSGYRYLVRASESMKGSDDGYGLVDRAAGEFLEMGALGRALPFLRRAATLELEGRCGGSRSRLFRPAETEYPATETLAEVYEECEDFVGLADVLAELLERPAVRDRMVGNPDASSKRWTESDATLRLARAYEACDDASAARKYHELGVRLYETWCIQRLRARDERVRTSDVHGLLGVLLDAPRPQIDVWAAVGPPPALVIRHLVALGEDGVALRLLRAWLAAARESDERGLASPLRRVSTNAVGVLAALAEVHLASGNTEDAGAAVKCALALADRLGFLTRYEDIDFWCLAGRVSHANGAYDAAARCLAAAQRAAQADVAQRAAYADVEHEFPQSQALLDVAELCEAIEQVDDAERLLGRVVAAAKKAGVTRDTTVPRAAFGLAKLMATRGDTSTALSLASYGLEIAEDTFGTAAPVVRRFESLKASYEAAAPSGGV